jgi:hypothetical protein
MADKQQNVKVVWQVDTGQLERAKNLSQQAQQAADKYHQSATQGAKGTSSELNKLNAEQARLAATIQNTNRASFTSYKAFTKTLQDLSRQYSDVKVKIDAATKSMNDQNRAIKEQAANTKSLAGQFSGLYATIRAVLAAGLLRETVLTALEMAKLAGNVDGVSKAFNRLPNSTLLLESLREATHGTVGDLELMQKALQANNFRIPLEQLGVLLEFAAVKAQQTGQEVNHLVDYIVSGIGYRSIKRLDDLGFTANRVKEALGGVTLQAASMAQVMNAVTTLMNEDLGKTGGFAETSATKVGQLTVAWTELRIEVAKKLTADGGFIEFLNNAVESMRLFVKGGGDMGKALRMEGVDKEAISLSKEFLETLGRDGQKNVEGVQQKMNSLVQTIGRYNDELKTNSERYQELNIKSLLPDLQQLLDLFDMENKTGEISGVLTREQIKLRTQLNEQRKIEMGNIERQNLALNRNKEVIQATIPILREFLDSLAGGADDTADQLGLIAAKMEQIEGVSDSIKAAKSTGEINKLNLELRVLNGELADLKAFGTTKQLLEVNGEVKLVPVEEYKIKQYKVQTTNAIGELEVKTKPIFGTDSPGATQPLIESIQRQLDEARFTIPAPVPTSGGVTPMSEWDKIGKEFSDNWKDLLGQGIDDTAGFFDAVIEADANQYEQRISKAREFYDEQINLAGNNERAKDKLKLEGARLDKKLRKEAFEADKRAQRSSALISGAAGIVRAFATLDYYQALVAAAFIAAETLAQVATIEQQNPRFKDGVIDLKGPGTKTSDSINAKLSKGESVMTADQTAASKGLLMDIRKGKLSDKVFAKTIDSKVLESLKLSPDGVQVMRMDDTNIIEAINGLKKSQPDYAEKFGQLMKSKRNSDEYKLWVRAKSF